MYEHAPEERLDFAIVAAESPDSPQPVHHEAPMDALLEPQLPEVEAEAPRIDDHEPKAPLKMIVHTMRHLWNSRNPTSVVACVVACAWFVTEVRARCINWEPVTCDKH